MKKTVNINDEIYQKARIYAITNGVTVTTVINQAIANYLDGHDLYDSVKELIEDRLSKLESKVIDTSETEKHT